MSKKTSLTAERLREWLDYDAKTGVFLRKMPLLCRRVGEVAGSKQIAKYSGGLYRLRIGVEGVRYMAHRLAWLHYYGAWPEGEIDHIDGDPSNNRIANLRDVSGFENQQNRRRANKNSKSGLLGARRQAQKGKDYWYSTIMVRGEVHYLGSFPTAMDAHRAYMAAKSKLHSTGAIA